MRGLTWPAWRLDLRRLLKQAADLGWRVVATVVYYHAKDVYNIYVDLAYVPVHALRVVGVLLHVAEVLLRLAVVLFNAFHAVLTYNFVLFMTLPIYATLASLDLRLLEAGNDLYGSPAVTFRTVTLPLSAAGVMSGTLLTFIPAAGDYINASREFLGSTDTTMIGNVIETNFLVLQNFPAAAALSLVLMAAILILVSLYVRRSGTEELL